MAKYIDREEVIERINKLLTKNSDGSVAKNYYNNGVYAAKTEIVFSPVVTDIQPVDTKEILRHLDSMMICISNAYNTSHFLLESDMKFIEKQEKIIKELLSGMKGEENG